MSPKGRLALWGALFGIGVLGGTAYAGAHYLTHAPRFRVRRIEVASAPHAPRDELRSTLERYRGRNLFRLDLRHLERDLEKCRWVKRAAVKRVRAELGGHPLVARLVEFVETSKRGVVPSAGRAGRDRAETVEEEIS